MNSLSKKGLSNGYIFLWNCRNHKSKGVLDRTEEDVSNQYQSFSDTQMELSHHLNKSQILNPKSRGKGLGLGLALQLYRPSPHHPTHNFSHLKCQSSDGKRPSMTFHHDLPWHFMTLYDLLSPSMTSIWPSKIKCLLSRPGIISRTFQAQVNSHSIPRLRVNCNWMAHKIIIHFIISAK